MELSSLYLILFVVKTCGTVEPKQGKVLPLGKDIASTRLIHAPSRLFRNSLRYVLSSHIPLTQNRCRHPYRLNALPTKQYRPLLRMHRHPLFYVIHISPLCPILSTTTQQTRQLLTNLPIPLHQRSRHARLLYPSTRETYTTTLPNM